MRRLSLIYPLTDEQKHWRLMFSGAVFPSPSLIYVSANIVVASCVSRVTADAGRGVVVAC